MSENFAKAIAEMVGGKAIQSGGGVWVVSKDLGTSYLILGKHGWEVHDKSGAFTYESN